jgi:hypothetical protein
MISPAQLAKAFARNSAILRMQAEGLGHADSLVQTPYRMNCFNWVVGHIVAGRDDTLALAGAAPLFEQADRYRRESDPIVEDGPDVVPFDRLLDLVDASQQEIDRVIGSLTDDRVTAETLIGEKMVSLGRQIHFAYFHDTYHTGQTEILRQVAGKNDSII